MFNRKIILFICMVLHLRVHAAKTHPAVQRFKEMVMECAKDFPMSGDDIEQLKNKQLPDTDNMRCLFACAFKASGMMDDQGKLSVDGVNNQAQAYLTDDTDKLAKAKEFTDACKSVNDVEVSDGNKGCERAALIFKCSVDKAPQFGFGM